MASQFHEHYRVGHNRFLEDHSNTCTHIFWGTKFRLSESGKVIIWREVPITYLEDKTKLVVRLFGSCGAHHQRVYLDKNHRTNDLEEIHFFTMDDKVPMIHDDKAFQAPRSGLGFVEET
uniref:Uncharacterized protein n=1 Tax=Romanomermis culicivorax TaxID=13658 RepID=A0A915JMQ7_ROMCU